MFDSQMDFRSVDALDDGGLDASIAELKQRIKRLEQQIETETSAVSLILQRRVLAELDEDLEAMKAETVRRSVARSRSL